MFFHTRVPEEEKDFKSTRKEWTRVTRRMRLLLENSQTAGALERAQVLSSGRTDRDVGHARSSYEVKYDLGKGAFHEANTTSEPSHL